MRNHRVVAAFLLASAVLAPVVSTSPVAADPGTRTISSSGTATLPSLVTGNEGGVTASEFALRPSQARRGLTRDNLVKTANSFQNLPAFKVAPAPGPTSATIGLNFEGLNHRDQRLANGGNQFSLE